MISKFTTVTVPLAVIRAYRLIPERARRRLFRGPGTSARALAAVAAGGGWRDFWFYALPRSSAGPGVAYWSFESLLRGLHGGPFDWEHYR